MSTYHIPVLLRESIDGLNIRPDGIYVDATYGGGGHSAEVLAKIRNGRLYAFDQDEDVLKNLIQDQRFFFILGNFRYLKNYMAFCGVQKVDGLLADLGVSSHHFNTPQRGFSYRTANGLDMRMNQKGKTTAEDVVNNYETAMLAKIFREYGEITQAGKIASLIVQGRNRERITTVSQLVECIEPMIPKRTSNQFLSKVFQAIRIEVNQELENLKQLLISAGYLLKPGGRLVIISYHSLEDRLVKNFLRWGNPTRPPEKDLYGRFNVPFRIITRKPVVASEDEIKKNPRARSAKLRIAEKTE
jgi:16S rRNA (cytosine1402-N4)-methyltransferase